MHFKITHRLKTKGWNGITTNTSQEKIGMAILISVEEVSEQSINRDKDHSL